MVDEDFVKRYRESVDLGEDNYSLNYESCSKIKVCIMARGRINIPLNYMPPAEVGTSEPTLPARKLPEVGLQSLEGAASVVKPIAEMLPGSGFVTGVRKRCWLYNRKKWI